MASRDHGNSMSFRDGTDGDTDACATPPRHHRHHCCRPPHSTVIPPSGPSAPGGAGAQPELRLGARRRCCGSVARSCRCCCGRITSVARCASGEGEAGSRTAPTRSVGSSGGRRGCRLRCCCVPTGPGRGRERGSPRRYLHTQPPPRRGMDRRATSLPSPGIDTWLSPYTHRL